MHTRNLGVQTKGNGVIIGLLGFVAKKNNSINPINTTNTSDLYPLILIYVENG